MTNKARPPKLAVRLLSWVLDAEGLSEILGDLEEDFHLQKQSRSWYWKQTFFFAARCCPSGFRGVSPVELPPDLYVPIMTAGALVPEIAQFLERISC